MGIRKDSSLEPSLLKVISVLRHTRTPYMDHWRSGAYSLGRPRATMDFDIMLAADTLPEQLVRGLEKSGFDIDSNWARYNPMIRDLQTRFRSGQVALDILFPRDRHDRAAFARRRKRRYESLYLWFASPEDLLLQKLKAGRPQDFSDAAGILVRCSGHLDLRYIARWGKKLGIMSELQHVMGAAG